MNKKRVYLLLSVFGAVLPFTQFIPFLNEHGLDVALFLDQLFANHISGFFGMDVIVSAFVLFYFIITESRRLNIEHAWVPFVCTLSVGVSFGLPIFLYMREKKLEEMR